MSEVSVIQTNRGPKKHLTARILMTIVQESMEYGNIAVVARKLQITLDYYTSMQYYHTSVF